MRKRLFQPLVLTLLLMAALSIFAVSPASAATTQVHRATVSTTPARPESRLICQYRVTATAGLNVREGPGTNYGVRYVLAYNTTVAAYYDETYGTGYYWHQLDDGYSSDWGAANWLQKTNAKCYSV